jgi:hypothetical protein
MLPAVEVGTVEAASVPVVGGSVTLMVGSDVAAPTASLVAAAAGVVMLLLSIPSLIPSIWAKAAPAKARIATRLDVMFYLSDV